VRGELLEVSNDDDGNTKAVASLAFNVRVVGWLKPSLAIGAVQHLHRGDVAQIDAVQPDQIADELLAVDAARSGKT
jgi:hypothetical protein